MRSSGWRRWPWELRAGDPGSARCLRCPACELTGGKAGKRLVSPSEVLDKPSVSSGPPAFPGPLMPPMYPCGQRVRALQTHTTALFTSTPLLLCEEVMGYSATLVPFSSFLSGFLGGEAGTAVNDQGLGWGIMSHHALFWVNILGLLV